MGKIKQKRQRSLKLTMALYFSISLIFSYIGAFAFGIGTNYLQDWYRDKHPGIKLSENIAYEIRLNQNNHADLHYYEPDSEHLNSSNARYYILYWIICYAQVILIPIWTIFCVAAMGILFYNRELKKPIEILFDASKKISENQLDFTIEYKNQNELGQLCSSFDNMRNALYENNRVMWRSLEERKRLNSAFSHDLRTPLTVLKGYADFLEKYIPDGKVSEEKLMSVISMMNGHISRLEHYTQKMNTVQKLEDIIPKSSRISAEKLFETFKETGGLICGSLLRFDADSDSETLFIDTELVMQVYENLISNAVRYTENFVKVNCSVSKNMLTIAVLDDGRGFTEEALKNAVQPFFRDEKEPDKLHFGLGLYICRILCEKCEGNLKVENQENGGKVTAEFFCGNISENR